ncbi:DUF397 domain-containing protein [Streptomyces zingiberis]|uniref:DUF397 domain-containing protein n=1 Tax=Streptomyces zingiberis TaxID=2053010 RepID=A0ABX1C489_9ACTN|nr:DUF397 domain-containing protein [Streptomyces zingiberis]NJQ02439.1 DUF397 domain-containing protein [Streptomyces zingiberis]
MDLAPEWFKSSYSGGGGGNCIEVAISPGAVHIRDSKDTGRPALVLSPAAWSAFTSRAESAEIGG